MDDAGAAARERAESATAESATERTIFFSDAVIAIAITLLAIELPVPAAGSFPALWEALRSHGYEYTAFLISFAVIGNHWTTHHRVFRYVYRADGRTMRLNLLWLLVIVLTPFLTKVATASDGVLGFAFYAVPQAVQVLLMARIIHEIGQHGWFTPEAPVSLTRRGYLGSVYFAAGFLISVPTYLLIGGYAVAAWWLVPLVLTRVTRRFVHHDG